MRRVYLVLAVVAGLAVTAAAFGAAQAPARQRMTFGRFQIQTNQAEGSLTPNGLWTFSKGVTVTSQGLQLTCDTMKLWPAKGGQSVQRLEATGNVRVRGTYTANDGTPWKVAGTSQAASYNAADGQGVLRGNVNFQATNQTTQAVVTVKAAKAIYNTKTQKLEFPQTGEPVHVEWQQPQPEKPAPAAPAGPSAGEK